MHFPGLLCSTDYDSMIKLVLLQWKFQKEKIRRGIDQYRRPAVLAVVKKNNRNLLPGW